jgi:hypothetical protein
MPWELIDQSFFGNGVEISNLGIDGRIFRKNHSNQIIILITV